LIEACKSKNFQLSEFLKLNYNEQIIFVQNGVVDAYDSKLVFDKYDRYKNLKELTLDQAIELINNVEPEPTEYKFKKVFKIDNNGSFLMEANGHKLQYKWNDFHSVERGFECIFAGWNYEYAHAQIKQSFVRVGIDRTNNLTTSPAQWVRAIQPKEVVFFMKE
jgi:hypothetical protein